MHGISQEVVIDTIQKTTLLDKKATVAQGNIARQRDTLLKYNRLQGLVIDSLTQESDRYRLEADTLRVGNKALQFGFEQEKIKREATEEKFDLQEKAHKQELKNEKKKKWTWFSWGALLSFVITFLTTTM